MAAAAILGISRPEWRSRRERHEEGRLGGSGREFGNQHAGRQMKGRETNEEGRLGGSGSNFGNQQLSL